MPGGITAQYGFLYQKYVYILMILNYVALDKYFTYEGIDDIDIDYEEKNSFNLVSIHKESYIQAKSGRVDENCMIKIIANWMNVEEFSLSLKFVLYVENELPFSYQSCDFISKLIDAFKCGGKKRKNAILRMVYDKYSSRLSTSAFHEEIANLLNSVEIKPMEMKNIENELYNLFETNYCNDIKIFELAKKKRCERFISYIKTEIDDSLKEKKPLILGFSKIITFIQKVSEEINDHQYKVDVCELKKAKIDPAMEIVNMDNVREVQQLRLVNDDNKFIIEGIIQKLVYEEFRGVYDEIKKVDISNLEQEAKENYNDAILEVEDVTPKKVFIFTTKKDIKNKFLPEGAIYRKGCYIYLTGQDIPKEIRVSWGSDNE